MVLTHFYEKQRPKGYLTPQKGLLLDIPYPFFRTQTFGLFRLHENYQN